MMRYLKDSKEIMIKIEDPFPEDTAANYHSALLGLLENLDPNYGITEHQYPLLQLLGAFKHTYLQLTALSHNSYKADENDKRNKPSFVIWEKGFYLIIKSLDEEFGAKIVRALLFYTKGCLEEADEETLFYALDLLSNLLPTDKEMNDSFNVK